MSYTDYIIEYIDEDPEVHEEKLPEEKLESKTIDDGFVVRLIDYLENTFPSYGQMDNNVKSELKKVLGTGTEEKMKEVNRVKKKVNDVISKEKKRFLDRVSNKVEVIKVKTNEN